jgi:hypothetical protein
VARRRGSLRGTVQTGGAVGGLPGGRARALHRVPLHPYTPPLPPAGSYDPALDAQRAAANRGILDTRQDTELGLSRAGQDYGLGVEDLQRGQTRGNEDIARAGGRLNEDFRTNTQALARSFNILAGQQAQAQRQLGVSTGGAVLQAAAKRKANMGIQRQALETGYQRGAQDLATQRNRLTEDTGLGIGRLGVGYNRQVTDFGTAGSRAERENTMFGLDVNAQRYFQAAQSGWTPPRRPRARR